MRRVSLNARRSVDAPVSLETEVVLFMIEHAALASPLRFSTDPTERLSLDPLEYGTRSTWRDSNPIEEPFRFIIASADLPSDVADAPASARIVLDNVHHGLGQIMRSVTDRPRAHMAVVLADSPDVIEVQFTNMHVTGADGDVAQVSLTLGRPLIEAESVPMDRMTKDRFPGLFL